MENFYAAPCHRAFSVPLHRFIPFSLVIHWAYGRISRFPSFDCLHEALNPIEWDLLQFPSFIFSLSLSPFHSFTSDRLFAHTRKFSTKKSACASTNIHFELTYKIKFKNWGKATIVHTIPPSRTISVLQTSTYTHTRTHSHTHMLAEPSHLAFNLFQSCRHGAKTLINALDNL